MNDQASDNPNVLIFPPIPYVAVLKIRDQPVSNASPNTEGGDAILSFGTKMEKSWAVGGSKKHGQ
jgi:hypothetical protein